MANYLLNHLSDHALLAFPYNSNFDFQSLFQVAKDLEGKKEISLEDWIELSCARFHFSSDQALIYYENFNLSFRSCTAGKSLLVLAL